MVMLTGCSGNSSTATNGKTVKVKLDPKNPVSVDLWHYYNGPQKVAFDELVSKFNETVGLEQGIVITTYGQGSVNQLAERVIESADKKVGASDMPDVFAAYSDTVYQVDKRGLVAPLDKYFTTEEIYEYKNEYIEEGRFDSEKSFKIFPIAKSTEIFMLNKTDWDKFASATNADINELKTIEGVVRISEKYYSWTDSLTPDKENDGKAFFGRDSMANYFLIGCKELGVDIFSVTEGKAVINADKQVIRKLWDNFYVPYIKGHFGAYGKFRSDDAKTGDILSLVCSTSGSAYFPTQVTVNDNDIYPIEFEVFEAPRFEGSEPYAVQQGAGMVVIKSDEKTEYAATVFLKWFTEARRNIEFAIGSGYMPVKKEAYDIDLLKEVIQNTNAAEEIKKFEKIFPVCIETVNNNKLYTSDAFEGGADARIILEKSLMNKANEDLTSIKEMNVNNEDAIAVFCKDENFEKWYNSFVSDLNSTISK